MNRRQLFLSTAKAAFLAALGGGWRATAAEAQPAAPRRLRRGGQVQGAPGLPSGDSDDRWPSAAAARAAAVWRRDQSQRRAIRRPGGRRAIVPPSGRAQHPAHHDRRRGLRRAEHVRRRHSDAGARSHRQSRPALHPVPFHRALLADARGAYYRPQPSLGRLRRGCRTVHGFSRATISFIGKDERHHRRDPEAERLRDVVVRQGPQHAGPGRARPGRSTTGRPGWALSISTDLSAATPASGSRTCSATPRRSIPLLASPDWNLTTAMADDAIDWLNQLNRDRPEQAVLLSTTFPAGPMRRTTRRKEWIDKIQRHAPVRRGLEQAARADLRQPEEARRDPARTPN